MKSTNETGHVKNVANFEDLISFCTAYGISYNPSKTTIVLSALNAKFIASETRIAKVTNTKNSFDYVTGIRQIKFAVLKPLATKIINALDATDASKTVIKDAKTINRKLQGTSPKTAKTPLNETNLNANTPKTISTSQQSYDRLISAFNELIDLVEAEQYYIPNEIALKVVTLHALLLDLKAANSLVISKNTEYSNARIERNETLYDPTNGLVVNALDVKKYVKSVFGATSPQYKQISGLKFSKPIL
jgi:hypothetical protein